MSGAAAVFRLVLPAPDEAAADALFARFPDGVLEDAAFSLYRPLARMPHVDGAAPQPVPDDWPTAYHAWVPRVIAGRVAVRPPWVAGEPDDLVIDPGTAFGAGTHPTTQLCLELLSELEPGGALCDWGAGTGVLAVAAARLGWAPVTAVDVDATDLAAANAARNAVDVSVVRRDLTREPAPWAPVVVANLPALATLAIERPPRLLVASGMLADAPSPPLPGMRISDRRERDGWAAVVMRG